ncbi:MAG: hypothetical protein M1816_007600 [Peltula sp. TS41687]|nr:MAG: hypothetical protein M1816_007600 [Peltula sp. TS41687]
MVSIIAKFRAGHRIAQEQPSTKAQASSNASSAPYRHVPTHAITDALSGAPSYYRAHDKRKIMEQNKLRGQLSRPTTSDGSLSTRSSLGSPSGRSHHSMDQSPPPLPPLSVDRIHGAGKGKLRADRHEAGIRRSPLSSMEISPHISAANSTKSTNSASSQSSVESLSRIAEESAPPRADFEETPHQIRYTTIPNFAMTSDETLRQEGSIPRDFWSAPRQLSTAVPDVSPPMMTPADAGKKSKRGWSLRRKSNAKRG